MRRARSMAVIAVLTLPAIVLAWAGTSYYFNGSAVNAAFPVPLYRSINRIMPKAAYRDAILALRHSTSRDGNAQFALAEAERNVGESGELILWRTSKALTSNPASAIGWAFYAEMLAPTAPVKAGHALGQSFAISPYEYFWAGRRVLLAWRIWNFLDTETKSLALRQAKLLWEEPLLRDNILPIATERQGQLMLSLAFTQNPDDLRAMYRWVSARRRQIQQESAQR